MTTKSKINSAIQVVLGLLLLATGINKFVPFMGSHEMPDAANQFMQALGATGYMMPMIAITEILVGALLVIHLWSALALVLLAPLSVNVVLFHIFLAPDAIAMALAVALLNLYLLFVYRAKYMPMLRPKA